MTAIATHLAALSAARINEMTAVLLGQPVKRAASKADAIARYERAVAAAAPVTLAEPAAAPAPVVEEPAAAVEEALPAPAPAKPARVRKAAPAVPGKADPAKAAKKVKTAAPKPAAPGTAGEPRAGSKRGTILEMVRRKRGATEAEICATLGWVKCGATIGRVLKAAGITPRKVKDEQTGRIRYFAG